MKGGGQIRGSGAKLHRGLEAESGRVTGKACPRKIGVWAEVSKILTVFLMSNVVSNFVRHRHLHFVAGEAKYVKFDNKKLNMAGTIVINRLTA